MIELAVKAGLPLIGVRTDDLPNFEATFASVVGKKIVLMSKFTDVLSNPWLYYTVGNVTLSNKQYRDLMTHGKTLIIVNPEPAEPLVFDAGSMPTPTALLRDYLTDQLDDTLVEPAMRVLNGLSLRVAAEVVALAQAKYDGITNIEQLRSMRSQLQSAMPGLTALDTETGFYEPTPEIEEWLHTNAPYFVDPDTPYQLVPRGLMMAGPPGTGKSLASKRIAQVLKVPLFRIDVASTLTKYIGESEARMQRALQQVEREAPCVLLLDEVEKIFKSTGSEGSGVIDRILSLLLWWLQEHRSRVLIVMTTNDKDAIPPELYRTGRLDKVFSLEKMTLPETRKFIAKVYADLMLTPLTPERMQLIAQELDASGVGQYSHAEAAAIAYTAIKKHLWYKKTLTNVEAPGKLATSTNQSE